MHTQAWSYEGLVTFPRMLLLSRVATNKDQEEEIALKEPPFCGVPVYRTEVLTLRPG